MITLMSRLGWPYVFSTVRSMGTLYRQHEGQSCRRLYC
jgi:hypothetical protein